MTDIVTTDTVVVGAGISGLATAHFLARDGIAVRIVEKSGHIGGTIHTRHVNGFLIDCGPNSGLETTPLLGELFADLDLRDSLEYARDAAKNRYVVRNGKLHALPMNPFSFLKTPLFSAGAKLRLLKEPFIPPADAGKEETLAEFVKRRLGSEFLDYAINPFVSGVYAGSPENLSVRSSFPKLYELEQKYGSLIKGAIKGKKERKKRGETSKDRARLFSFKGGMSSLTEALAKKYADRIHTESHIRAIRRRNSRFELNIQTGDRFWSLSCRHVVVAIPAHAYDDLKFEMEFPIRNVLRRLSYPPVAVVFFGYLNNPCLVPLDGFGFLIPQKENRNILGTIWNSTLFTNRAPAGGASFTTFVGGVRQPENALLTDGKLAEVVQNDLRGLLGIRQSPDSLFIKRWEQAIPQYNIGHHDIVGAIEAFEKETPGIYISGNFRGGVSIGDCVRQAHSLAQRLKSGRAS